MENKFVMNNFRKAKVTLQELPCDYKKRCIQESIRSQIDSNEFSLKIKKYYATVLLTGALFIKPDEKKSVIEQLVAMEIYTPFPLMHIIEMPFSGVVSMYNVFDFIRDELWEKEPELLLEIAKEQYNRVWDGWTNEKNIGNLIYEANYFWEPLAQDLLSKYAGCKSRNTASYDTSMENALSCALTAFLCFGKTGHLGVQFNTLMAGIGAMIPSIPICINTENRISDISCRIKSGNGVASELPSIVEEFYTLSYHE